MFIAALFIIAKTWKQPKCPSMDEWIEEMWYFCCMYINIHTHTHTYTHTQRHIHIHTYTMESYSAIKMKEILPFATIWIDPEGIMLSEISQTEKDKYHMISFIWNLKNGTNELIYKTEIESQM